LFTLGETTPPAATSMPIVDKKGKRKAKAQGKKKQRQVTASSDSPAMGTRSKNPLRQRPVAHTRSKKKLSDLNL